MCPTKLLISLICSLVPPPGTEPFPLILEDGAPSAHKHTRSHRQETQGQYLKDMKDALTVPLTLSQGLLDEVTLGLQLGDQVPAFQKLLLLLQHTKGTHVLVRKCRKAHK